MFRNTYALINNEKILNNIIDIKNKYPNYKYYIGIVKNDAYKHGIEVVADMIQGGINYLGVSSLDEAMKIREKYKNIPILILEPVNIKYIETVINNNITITIDNLKYLEQIINLKLKKKIKIHFKIDIGMNRLGFKDKEEIDKAYCLIKKNNNIILEGIYSHFATTGRYDVYYNEGIKKFNELISNIDLKEIPIIHMDRSLTFVSHNIPKFVTGVRLGIIMYGFSGSIKKDLTFKGKIKNIKRKVYLKLNNIPEPILENNLNLETAFSLYSEVISIRKVKKGEKVGYNACTEVKDNGYIATICIGYADGVTKDFKYVFINNKKYEIISDSMDMIMAFVDDSIQIGDKVEIFGDNIKISEVTRILGTNSYHLFNQITTRVPRIYKNIKRSNYEF